MNRDQVNDLAKISRSLLEISRSLQDMPGALQDASRLIDETAAQGWEDLLNASAGRALDEWLESLDRGVSSEIGCDLEDAFCSYLGEFLTLRSLTSLLDGVVSGPDEHVFYERCRKAAFRALPKHARVDKNRAKVRAWVMEAIANIALIQRLLHGGLELRVSEDGELEFSIPKK